MTRLTPSDPDQADTGSAPRSAAIPSQRSVQGLRLLVLGNGSSAGALRSRAADAGAELAQRFSSRVTHVVVDDTVASDDARVARARTAGLPVLDVAQGEELLGGAAAAEGDVGTGEAVREEVEEPRSAAPVVRPRSEHAEVESEQDEPSNVFAGSALEAVLLFPPLPADEAVTSCGCGEDCGGGLADVDVDADGDADVDGVRGDEEEGEVVVREEPRYGQAQPPGIAAASVAWALVPLASLGLLTPVAMGYAAYRLRSRTLAAATGWYTLAVVAAFVVSAATPRGGGAAAGDLLTACLATSWLGGTVHGFLIRRRVFG